MRQIQNKSLMKNTITRSRENNIKNIWTDRRVNLGPTHIHNQNCMIVPAHYQRKVDVKAHYMENHQWKYKNGQKEEAIQIRKLIKMNSKLRIQILTIQIIKIIYPNKSSLKYSKILDRLSRNHKSRNHSLK
jgi:hypothetical protein